MGASSKESLEALLKRHIQSNSSEKWEALETEASPMQKMYFLYQEMHPNSVLYNLPLLVKIEGKLDIERIEKALQELISKQTSLRTKFFIKENTLYQKTQPEYTFSLETQKISSYEEIRKKKDLLSPFSFSEDSLMRVRHFFVSEDLHYLFFDLHHIIADASSFQILIRDIAFAYQTGKSLNSVKSYREFTSWQKAVLLSEKGKRAEEFWRRILTNLPPRLELPKDFERPKDPLGTGDRVRLHIPKDAVLKLKKLCAQSHISTYMFCLGVYAFLITKFSYQTSFMIGTSSEGRKESLYKDTIGAFVNTLPLKIEVDLWQTVREFLAYIRTLCFEAIDNEHYPFWKMVESFSDIRDSGRAPFFDTFFELHHKRRSKINIEDLECTLLDIETDKAKFDLTIEGYEEAEGIDFTFEYSSELFKRSTIEKISEYYSFFIDQFINNPEIQLSEISSLIDKEARFLEDFNKTDLPFSEEGFFIQRFRKIVTNFPDRIALSSSKGSMTYQFLDYKTDQLAAKLQAMGVTYEDRIACVIDRSDELLISLLAILKVGGVYIPIGPSQPIQRIDEMLEDCQPSLVLYNRRHRNIVEKLTYKSKRCDIEGLIQAEYIHETLREVKVFPESLAYIIFTSGSTGKPKGAMLHHEGMINHLLAKIHDLSLSEKDVLGQTSSQTFDVSIWQFFSPLLVGAKVSIVEGDTAWDPSLLFPAFQKERITIFETVPSHLKIMMDFIHHSPNKNPLNFLRINILNGEVLTPELCKDWYEKFPNILILNAYGQTECSDDTCHFLVEERALSDFFQSCPIGRPFQNIQGYVLDKSYQFVPIASMGQIYFSGIGVGRGYFNRPDLTAKSFLPCPFEEGGKRMYRTGDVGCILSGGYLSFSGREDSQVKIRGSRVELREIEHKIMQHPSVKDVVVSYKNELLSAYVIFSEKGQDKETYSLKKQLKDYLPIAMVPDHIIPMAAFPLHPSGKVNFSALPQELPTKEGSLPVTATEKFVASVWSEVFPKTTIFRETDFFSEGGNSLLAMQILNRIRSHYEVQIPLKMLFTFSTLEVFSREIDNALAMGNKQKGMKEFKVVEDRKHRHEPFPVTEVQQAYLLGRSGLYSLGDVSVHVYAEYEINYLSLKKLEDSWNTLIKRHEALRMIFPTISSQQILEAVPHYEIEELDFRGLSSEDREKSLQLMREEMSHRVFNVQQWPLFAIKAIQMQGVVRLILSFDVLILDGWSIDIILRDWLNIYQEKSLEPQTLSLSFRDYVLSLEKIKQGEIAQLHKKYWMDRVEAFPLGPNLPIISNQKLEKQSFSRVSAQISEKEWDSINQTLKTNNISPTGFLATIFGYILKNFSGDEHFALNLTLFDRMPIHREINDICGDFTSLTLLEMNFTDSSATFIERLKEIQTRLWEDLDHHLFTGVEFIREVAKAKKNSGSILYPVVFTSVLGIRDEQDKLVEKFLGKEVFSITQTPQVWLDFKAYEVGEKLNIEWDFVSALFPKGFIEAMHQTFVETLKVFALQPKIWGQKFFHVFPPDQLRKRIQANRTKWPVQNTLLHKPFYECAKRLSNKPAIITPERSLSYGELSEKSLSLAALLRNKGAKKNQSIAIFLEKGWEQIVAVLGVLSSGAAYLPIDPSLPTKRILELLQDAEVRVVLTKSSLSSKIRKVHEGALNWIYLDKIDENSIENPMSHLEIDGTDLAYVIFTSGSTGRSKAVAIEHRSVSNTILDINERWKMSSGDGIFALSSLSFDLSVYDIFGPLSVGATLVIPHQKDIKNPEAWHGLIEKHRVTFWNTVPLFMQMYIEYLEGIETKNRSLRCILLSGDWIPTNLPKRIVQHVAPPSDIPQIMSLGGATEASIWSVGFVVDSTRVFERSIPYGKALRNQTIYVLNKDLMICPDWVSGEIYIGGSGLAREYLNNPSETKARFFAHPDFGRLYKTGDLGRYLPDGNIEFLGRRDFQVKFRGFRVELGEIESILIRHQDVSNAKVIVQRQHTKSESLIAYITPVLDDNNDEPGVLLDASKRLAFKIQKKSQIPHLEGDSYALPKYFSVSEKLQRFSARKSYRNFQGNRLVKEDLLEWLKASFESDNPLRKDPQSSDFLCIKKIGGILEHLSSVHLEGYPLPKFLYASAGGTYSVKVFCLVEDSMENLPAGLYQYDPGSHSLCKKKDFSQKSVSGRGVSFFLAADVKEIEPLYGKYAKLFCQLEAGCIERVLQQACHTLQVPIKEEKDSIGYEQFFPKKEAMLFLSSFRLFPEKNREERSDGLSFFLYIKKGMISSLDEGWYQYSKKKEILEKIGFSVPFDLGPSADINYGIYKNSSAILFFLSEQEPCNTEKILKTGSFAHLLMQKGIDKKIGCCSIGMLDQRGQGLLKQAVPEKSFIHALCFGPIDQKQLDAKQESRISPNLFTDRLQEYLREYLPPYMVPSSILVLESFPMTPNGKVDIKKLPQAKVEEIARKVVAPENVLQESLFKIWQNILEFPGEIGIDDNFFEAGGNSLSAVKMQQEINKAFLGNYGIEVIFHYPTIRKLAEHIGACKTASIDLHKIEARAQRRSKSAMFKKK